MTVELERRRFGIRRGSKPLFEGSYTFTADNFRTPIPYVAEVEVLVSSPNPEHDMVRLTCTGYPISPFPDEYVAQAIYIGDKIDQVDYLPGTKIGESFRLKSKYPQT